MNLTEFIKNLDLIELTKNDISSILSIINTPSIEHTDSTKYGPGGLLLKLPTEQVGRCAQVFKAAATNSALFTMLVTTFSVEGFDFSNDVVRANIDTLVSMGMEQEDADALKAIGRWQTSPAFDALGRDATKEDVVTALDEINATVPKEYPLRDVALNVHLSKQIVVRCVVTSAAEREDGTRVSGEQLAVFAAVEGTKLPDNQASLVTAIRAAIEKYLETL